MNNYDEFVNINNLGMDDVEKFGKGLDTAGSLLTGVAMAIAGVIALFKLFSDDN